MSVQRILMMPPRRNSTMADRTVLPSMPGAGRLPGLLVVCALLSACAIVPDYERPELDLPAADATVDAGEQQAQRQAMADWWQQFKDPVLDRLINSALEDNLDIAMQTARIREARASLGLARTAFYPTLGGQIEASRSKASLDANPQLAAAGGDRRSSAYSVSAALDYELNLFSALAGHEAAKAQLLASAYSRDAVRLAVISDIVANYMSLRSAQRMIRITKATIETRAEGLDLAEKRYASGAISKLELLQERALLSSVRAQLPELRSQVSQLESALAILAGKTPREIMQQAELEPAPLADVELPGELPQLLPSALVNRRPDIRAAEAALAAANAQVGVARSQYFPSLNLTALIGTAATAVGDLFRASSEQASIGGILSTPILSFGRIAAQVDTTEAQREQATIMYRQAVRQAFREVRDALIGVEDTQDRVESVRHQVHAYEETLKLAQNRYEIGSVGLRDVLEAQRQLYSAQLELSEAIRDRFVTTANLFKAL